MREIKFRAWDREEGFIDVARLDIADGSLYKYLITGKAYDYWNEVKLMQYTGLKDMNEKDIYEGDILQYDILGYSHKTVVWFKNGAFVTSWQNGNINLMYDYLIDEGCLRSHRVIGNIYEDKDILGIN